MTDSKDFMTSISNALRTRGDAGLMMIRTLGKENNRYNMCLGQDWEPRMLLLAEVWKIINDYNKGQDYKSNLKESGGG